MIAMSEQAGSTGHLPGIDAEPDVTVADARRGCAGSRWQVLADCRDSLRSLVRWRNRPQPSGGNATSDFKERDQTMIRLRVWQELGFAEIGRRLDVSEDAARMQYARSIDRLRKRMRSADGTG